MKQTGLLASVKILDLLKVKPMASLNATSIRVFTWSLCIMFEMKFEVKLRHVVFCFVPQRLQRSYETHFSE